MMLFIAMAVVNSFEVLTLVPFAANEL